MVQRKPSSVVMEIVSDPVVLAKSKAQNELFELNWTWFEQHAVEIYAKHRGKCLCIAGQELFVAETPAEALALAKTAHPNDDGFFTRIIPKEKGPRVYANQRIVVSL